MSEETTSVPASVPHRTDNAMPDMSALARDYLTASINDLLTEVESKSYDMSWMDPAQRAVPAHALARIKSICQHVPELFSALQAVVATHGSVPREVLAVALKKYRPDLEASDSKEIIAMLTSISNGGRSGFDSVLRNKKRGGGGSAAALPWGAGTE